MTMAVKDFWGEYFDYWDQFLKQWADRCEALTRGQDVPYPDDGLTTHLAKQFEASGKNNKSRLVYDELPEPYYGNPKDAKFVLIQFNPGKSSSADWTKFYSKRTDKGAFLIRSFLGDVDKGKTNCNQNYSEFAKHWSSLNATYPDGVNPSEVCGHDWWYNKSCGRWIRDFSGVDLSRVFVIEACPYHSKDNPPGVEDMPQEYLLARVIVPAAVAAENLGYVVCVNKSVIDCISANGGERIARWEGGMFNAGLINKCIMNWRNNAGGEPIGHKYELWRVGVGNRVVLFLYVMARQMKYPVNMDSVEDGIRDFINKINSGCDMQKVVDDQMGKYLCNCGERLDVPQTSWVAQTARAMRKSRRYPTL